MISFFMLSLLSKQKQKHIPKVNTVSVKKTQINNKTSKKDITVNLTVWAVQTVKIYCTSSKIKG